MFVACPLPPPKFWIEPLAWIEWQMYGLWWWAILPAALVTGLGLVVLRRYARHVAYRRATTPDGLDADYREPNA
jgi:hypothetical protein